MRLKNVLLVVKDIEQSKKFYNDLFGMQALRDFGDNVILTDAFLVKAKEYPITIEFVGDVRMNSWGKRVVMLKDPYGHLIEVAER